MYQKNPLLLEHSGIHSDMMKLVEAITTKYPTSRDLAAALRKFSAEQGGNSKLDKYAMILDKDMDHKQLALEKKQLEKLIKKIGIGSAISLGLIGGGLALHSISKKKTRDKSKKDK